MADVLQTRLPQPYEDRLEVLMTHGVALWDVIAAARRRGSLDAELRDVRLNAVLDLVRDLRELRVIGFNGGTAARVGARSLGSDATVARLHLPSSSPAFTTPYEVKAQAWRALRGYL